jgi:hypothetical protein
MVTLDRPTRSTEPRHRFAASEEIPPRMTATRRWLVCATSLASGRTLVPAHVLVPTVGSPHRHGGAVYDRGILTEPAIQVDDHGFRHRYLQLANLF